MLGKFFGNNDAGQLTPKASNQSNPFEHVLTSSRKSSVSLNSINTSNGTSINSSNTGSTRSNRGSVSGLISSGLSSPSFFNQAYGGGAGDLTPGAVPVTPGALATTAISVVEPDFSLKSPPPPSARKRETPHAPKGRLSVKLISARHLASPSAASKPYVVVTFDQNEFISREPIHELGAEIMGVARDKSAPDSPASDGSKRSITNSTAAATDLPDTSAPISSSPSPASTLPIDRTSLTLPSRPQINPDGTPASEGHSTSGIGRALDAYRKSIPFASTSPPLTPTFGSPYPSLPTIITPIIPDESPSLQSLIDVSAHNPTWKHEVIFDVMGENSVLQIEIYDRSIEEEMFLGWTEIRPRLVNGHTVDQWFPLSARGDERVTGEIRIQIRYEKLDVKKPLGVNDFDFLRMIGKGTFGRVFQVRKKDTRRIYAMKVLSKREIVAKKEVAHTIGERKILQRSSESPFLLGLKFSFQTEKDLYLVMDYKSGGELFHHLQKEGRFTEDRARFYTAEIVLALEHLHIYDIVYRDLKPENILLDATGHISLCDFGLSKPDLAADALTNTFCGTTEYLAPEVLLDDHGYSKLVDFWSLGVLLFEMCCGWSPFYAEDTQQMYKLICFGKVKFPRGVIGEDGKQFVKGLLNRNPKHRLGATRDAAELKEHAFFKSIDWTALAARQIAPPFKPYVDSDESVANFDPEFTEANLLDEAPDDVTFDEEDPSADWLDQGNGGRGGGGIGDKSSPMAIKQRRPPLTVVPLTNSVQENFRGFTFSGEGESMIHRAAQFDDQREEEVEAQTKIALAQIQVDMDSKLSISKQNNSNLNSNHISNSSTTHHGGGEWEDTQ